MNRDQAKEFLQSNLTEYVNMITKPSRRAGRGMYVCPLCGSGTGQNNNGTGAFSITKDGTSWKCFSCNKSGDIFNLIAEHEGLTEFNDQLERACQLFNVVIDNTFTPGINLPKSRPQPKTVADFSDYIANCKAAVHETNYFYKRGFTDETINRYNLGYDKFKNMVVIPYNKNGTYYITRSTEGKAFRKPPTEEAGAEPLYNKADLYNQAGQPVFICEAPLDALSIIEADAYAIALGGTGEIKLIEQLKERRPDNMLIISLDNDEPGRTAAANLAKKLNEINIKYIFANYSLQAYPKEKQKDANDFLIGNKEQFFKDVTENIEEALKLANSEKIEALEAYQVNSGAGRLKNFMDGIHNGAITAYTPTGFKSFDKELDGGLYEGLYIIGAISSLGKTTLALQIMDNIAAKGKDVLIFTLEMSANELIAKSLSRLTYELNSYNADHAKTNRGITTASRYINYSEDEKALISLATKKYAAYAKNIFILEGLGNIGADTIREAVKKHIAITGNTPIVLIDYVQILAPVKGYERSTDKQNTDKNVLELKRIARDFKTPVIGISSFNRDSYAQPASMAAFKESGAIEYGSDVLIALQPKGLQPGEDKKSVKDNIDTVNKTKAATVRELEAVILKNRNGKTGGKVSFKYSAMFNYFAEDKSPTIEDYQKAASQITI